jgi:WD40 repeat protein
MRPLFSIAALIVVILLPACASAPVGQPDPQRSTPTPTAAPWRASAAPVSLDNITQVAALGRLDQPDVTSTIVDFALTPDSTRLAALTNTQLIVWDLLTGQVVFSSGRSEATQIYISPDKTELYGITPTGDGVIFDAATGGILNRIAAHPAYNGVAAFDDENGWLALGGSDGTVKVWDPLERTSLATFQAQGEGMTALAFSPDGERLATAGGENSVRLWDWRSQTMLRDWATLEADPFTVALSSDGTQAAAGVINGAFIWSADADEALHRVEMGENGATRVLQFSPDDAYLLGGSRPAGAVLWSVESGAVVSALPDTGGDGLSAAFSPDGSLLVTASVGNPVSLWNLTQITGDTIGRADLAVASGEVLDVAWSDDGRLLLFFDARGFVYVWGIPQAVAENAS